MHKKWLEYSTLDGDFVTLRARDVMAVLNTDQMEETRIVMRSGNAHLVVESYNEVRLAIGAMQPSHKIPPKKKRRGSSST